MAYFVGWLMYVVFNFFSFIITAASSFTYVLFNSFLTAVLHTSLSKQLVAFPHRRLAHLWKMNATCCIGFCQMLERMFAEFGWNCTTHLWRVHIAADWATRADFKQIITTFCLWRRYSSRIFITTIVISFNWIPYFYLDIFKVVFLII